MAERAGSAGSQRPSRRRPYPQGGKPAQRRRVRTLLRRDPRAGRGHRTVGTGNRWPLARRLRDRQHQRLTDAGFPFFESREIKHVEAALGLTPAERAVLLSDGHHAYAHCAAKTGVTHAQCWAHTRRGFFEAQAAEPEAAAEALALIGELYRIEDDIRQAGRAASARRIIGWRTPSRSSSASSPGSMNGSRRRVCCRAIR